MRSRARAATPPPQERPTAESAVPAARRRLPVTLLMLLSLVLGGSLLVVALAPPTPSATPDPAVAAALAKALTAGRIAVVEGAGEPPIGRVLAAGDAPASTLAKARAALGDIAGRLDGDRGSAASVALVDASGRVRLADGRIDRGATPALPGGSELLGRVLGPRGGVVVTSDGDQVVLAAPVTAGGEIVGAVVASAPLTTLLGSAAAALPEGPIAIGTADGTTWVATGPSASGAPLPANLLLGLAALALLALPLAWLANRPPRTRAIPAAPSADPAPARGSTATGVVAAPVQAQRLPAYQRPPTPTQAPAVAMAAAASGPAEAAPVPVAGPEAAPPPARKGRFGLGRRRAEPETAVAAPLLVEPPVVLATPSDELLDTLTGLGNQRAFGEEMDRLMVGWERNRVPFAVLLLDVDDLKITNARAGHTAGDEILRTLGRHVKAMLRFSDRAFRVGGDEIAVLLPHTDAPGAAQLGQRLLAKVRAGTGGEPAVAFSAGAAALPGPSQDRDQLMGHANAALAWGKTHGRASVLAYDPATHAGQTDAERVAQATAVAQVIAERTLRAVFQPIVDMQTGDVVGFEGLTRPTPGAPFTNPGQLFEAAELVGRTVELDAACFETIVQGARAIPSDRVVTINLSPRTMEAADFSVANVLEVLRSHDLDPGRVVLELTERESVLDLDRLRDNLSELQRAGVRIAADDVGAGNAGLRLLSQFRFDIVKVDLGLVQEGANNEASQAVLRSLRDLAQRWGAFVIAEGIETSTQLKVVRELGLSAGQGYLIGRPGTIVDLPPVDLDGLCEGGLMLQNAPVPSALPHGSPA